MIWILISETGNSNQENEVEQNPITKVLLASAPIAIILGFVAFQTNKLDVAEEKNKLCNLYKEQTGITQSDANRKDEQ